MIRGVKQVKSVGTILNDLHNHLLSVKDYVYRVIKNNSEELKMLDNLIDRTKFLTSEKYIAVLNTVETDDFESVRKYAGFIICCYTLVQCVYSPYFKTTLQLLSKRSIYFNILKYIDEIKESFELIN